MNKYFKYLHYLIRHKYYVAKACFRVGLFWQGIVHDWSKFLPQEYIPYARHFYGSIKERNSHNYDKAWLHHIHNNKHHWEHWCIPQVGPAIPRKNVFKPLEKAVPMPDKYILETVCDWHGAGRAQNNPLSVEEWFKCNRSKLILHPDTEKKLLRLFKKYKWLQSHRK